MSLTVRFLPNDAVADADCAFVVIAARWGEGWLFCRHRERHTWEIPGGHIEAGEDAMAAARRELWEETGALGFDIRPLCVYDVQRDGQHSYGRLYLAMVRELGTLPPLEIAQTRVWPGAPDEWTYPHIQPLLFARARESIQNEGSA